MFFCFWPPCGIQCAAAAHRRSPLTLLSEARPIGGRQGRRGEQADKARRICSTFRRPPLNNTQPGCQVWEEAFSLTPPSHHPTPPHAWTPQADGLLVSTSRGSVAPCRRETALTCDAARRCQLAAVLTVSLSLSLQRLSFLSSLLSRHL